ncbi:Derlin-1, partial [Fragariocoptes setiger]
MAEIADWFNRMPFFTRYWFGASVAIPVLCRLGVCSPYLMVLTPDFLAKLHVWKPLTAVFYYPLSGNKGFHYLVNLYFLYSYSTRLETGHFGPAPADFAFMLMFMWTALFVSFLN